MHLLTLLTVLVSTKKEEATGVAIGIDLGTTYSCVCIYDRNASKPSILRFKNGRETYPSVVKFDTYYEEGSDKPIYRKTTGWEAYNDNIKKPSPDNYFYAFKRLMGFAKSSKAEEFAEIERINKLVTYELELKEDPENPDLRTVYMLAKDDNGNIVKRFTPLEASVAVLSDLKLLTQQIHSELGIAVVTTPAYFNHNQTYSTMQAAKIAGLNAKRTCAEPVAAAYTYQLKHGKKKDDIYLVFDFGGGTLDLSILEHGDQVMEVKCYSGDNFLGGENVNDALFKYFEAQLEKDGVKLINQTEKLRLRAFIEDFKIKLCEKQNETPDEIVEHRDEFLYRGDKSKEFVLNTTEFNKACMNVFDRVRKYVTGKVDGILYKYAALGGEQKNISKVLLVGGSSRIPYIRKMLGEIFGANKINHSLNPDTAVAEGACYYSATLSGYINEDVAIHLVDVLPMHIGIKANENVFEPILKKNATIPAKGSQIFTTAVHGQTKVRIEVGQGLRYQFSDCYSLGAFELELKKPQPKGVPQIEVTVDIDKDGEISVQAVDKTTGQLEKATFVRNDYSLTEQEIAAMVADQEANAALDEELRKRGAAVREFSAYIDVVREAMKNPGMSEDTRTQLDAATTNAEDWLEAQKQRADSKTIKEKMKEFMAIADPLIKPTGGVPSEGKVPTEGREDL
ncbi:Heat shock protein [Astathelohania contejeani]|uniref:Heat shock protein n=1 Tax=Astathelohania contejeani TaxID=164912 RepID=A0ABQ7HZ72_9MICR|nr:Heat shock protein [Thelohania contejeani]